ncbi:hypothetical protein ACNKHK_02000 [Shigella flexneri]
MASIIDGKRFITTGQIMARRILVVEDEAPIREMVCFVLNKTVFNP